MKVLLVDTAVSGHHVSYLKALISNENCEFVICVPKKISGIETKQMEIKNSNFGSRNFIQYYKWIKEIQSAANAEKPDIIQFLYGDIFYRYFGLGLSKFKKYKTVVTFHQIRNSFLRNISIKAISKKINTGIVHTEELLKKLNSLYINNAKHIEYPHFNDINYINKEFALKYLGLSDKTPVLLALGGTRYDKGLDILLEALKYADKPFQLIIAGQEQYFDKSFIENKIETYKDNVRLLLKFLSDEEFSICINACDFIVLPYRKIFTGASGPLGEGVWLRKTIIGPNHGSLGDIITKNNIGITFTSEDSYMLSKVINDQLNKKYEWNDIAENYRLTLSVYKFKNDYQVIYDELI